MTAVLALPIRSVGPAGSRRAFRVLGLGAVVAILVFFVAQGWTPARTLRPIDQPVVSAPGQAAPTPTASVEPDVDADAVVERATHRVVPVPGGLAASDPAYRARFDASGFVYTPAGSSERFALSLGSLQRGDHSIPIARRAWTGEGNVAERSVAQGVTERVTAGDGDLEWDVVLASGPAGSGALTVGASLDGITGTPTRVRTKEGPAWRLALRGGKTVHLDELVVQDARGAELYRALPAVTGTRLSMTVPDRVLATATYPLTLDPTVSGPTTVSGAQSSQASVAFDGTNHLVVWTQFVETREFIDIYRIYGVRVKGSDGSRLGTPFLISSSTDPGPNGAADAEPDVAWNGDSFLVVWTHLACCTSQFIESRRVSGTGTPLGAVRSLTNSGSQPAVAAEDNSDCTRSCPLPEWLVVWVEGGDAEGRLVYSDGTPLGRNPLMLGAPNNIQEVDVAANTTGYLVTSATYLSGGFGSENGVVRFQKVNKDGSLGVGDALEESTDYFPRVASDGTGFLVVFRRQTAGGGDIYGVTLERWGYIVRQPFPITIATGDQASPEIAYSGGTYLAAWRLVGNQSFDIHAARLASNGDLRDPNGGFGVARVSGVNEIDPAVAPAPEGKWVVDYEYGTTGVIQQRTVAPK